MDLTIIITATTAGKINWYNDNAVRGPSGAAEMNYLASVSDYTLDLSPTHGKISLVKGGVELDSDSDIEDVPALITAVETYLIDKKAADAAGFTEVLSGLV